MHEYTTQLVNFGNIVYQGAHLLDAKSHALSAGFECVILLDGAPLLAWSPISGWRSMCG
jgi:hypothetical protein